MSNEKVLTSKSLLAETGISLVDAERLILNILDARPKNSSLSPIEFCHKVIETSKRHLHIKEMSFVKDLKHYIKIKSELRAD